MSVCSTNEEGSRDHLDLIPVWGTSTKKGLNRKNLKNFSGFNKKISILQCGSTAGTKAFCFVLKDLKFTGEKTPPGSKKFFQLLLLVFGASASALSQSQQPPKKIGF